MEDEVYKAARRNSGSHALAAAWMNDEDKRLQGITPGDQNNVLHIAALYGNKDFITKVKDTASATYNELICKRNAKRETPLHLAAKSGDLETARALLEFAAAGCCWRETDTNGDTPLHTALRFRHEDIAKLILEKDMEYLVSVTNKAGESLAYLAAQNFCLEFLRMILDEDRRGGCCVSFSGSLGQTAFHPATNLTVDMMSILIERRKHMLKVQDGKRKTALHYAVEAKKESMVEVLLKADSSLAWLHEEDGLTPLHKAASMGLFPMVEMILELSPQSIEIREKNHGKTALHVAKMEAGFLGGCLKKTRTKELGNEVDDEGNTLLHLVLKNPDNKNHIVDTILEVGGVNWWLKNKKGETPMDLCKSDDQIPLSLKCKTLECKRKEIMVGMKKFYHKGVQTADDLLKHFDWDECLSYRGPNGDSILHIAARDGCMKLISKAAEHDHNDYHMLLLLGKNFKGETPLHLAAQQGQLRVVNAIILLCKSISESKSKKRENPNDYQVEENVEVHSADDDLKLHPWRLQSRNGDTPVHKAIRNNHSRIALLILHLDPDLASFVNKDNESLLYLAAANSCNGVLREIMMNSIRYSFSLAGPNGENPLHAAARYGESSTVSCLIKKWPELLNKVDDSGMTPLHHVAEIDRSYLVWKMLKEDKEAAFIYDNKGFTPLLRAAAFGASSTMRMILQVCLRSADLPDLGNNKTVIHNAKMQIERLNGLSTIPTWKRLVNESDMDGNTPLHSAILDNEKKKTFVLLESKGINLRIRNNQHQTPLDLCRQQVQNNQEEEPIYRALIRRNARRFLESVLVGPFRNLLNQLLDMVAMTDKQMNEVLQSTSVVGALLVTLSFAALFTIPGGYNDENNGQVRRMNEPAIRLFVAADVFAMSMGVAVLLNYVFAFAFGPMLNRANCVRRSILLLLLSLGGIYTAFLCGVYASVANSAIWIFGLTIVFAFFTVLCSFT